MKQKVLTAIILLMMTLAITTGCGTDDIDISGYADDDSVLFRLSLADICRKLGRLTDEVRDAALRTALLSPQPEKKKFGKKRYKKCIWLWSCPLSEYGRVSGPSSD